MLVSSLTRVLLIPSFSTHSRQFNPKGIHSKNNQIFSIIRKRMASSTTESTQTPSQNSFKFASIQMKGSVNKQNNLEVAFDLIKQAASKGAQVITLPECFNSPYGTKYFEDYSEVLEDDAIQLFGKSDQEKSGETAAQYKGDSMRPTFSMLSDAAKTHGIYLIGGSYPERNASGKYYNTSVVFDPTGERIATHRKVHLFDIDVPGKITFRESDVLSPGQSLTTFTFNSKKTQFGIDKEKQVSCEIGVGICYDLRFPEMAQIMCQKLSCKMLVYPGAFNMTTGPAHWKILQTGRALDNQCYVATASPARDPGAGYIAYGHSMVVSPWGVVLGELEEQQDILVTDIDLDYVDFVRSSIPVYSQKRADLYKLEVL